MKQTVTLADVARRAGLSKATVSYALRNHPKISEATRKKVRALAKKMGYRVHPLLQILASHRWKQPALQSIPVALLIESRAVWSLWQETHIPFLQQRCTQLGYSLNVIYLEDHSAIGQVEKILFARNMQGLIIGPVPHSPWMEALDYGSIAAISFGYTPHPLPIETVQYDFFFAAKSVLNRILNGSYQRIGILQHKKASLDDVVFFSAGIRDIVRERRSIKRFVTPFFIQSSIQDPAFEVWLKNERPDAVFSFYPHFYERLIQQSYQVPQEIAFACIHKISADHHMAGTLNHCDKIAFAAVDQLDSQIRLHEKGSQKKSLSLLIRPEWSPGLSLPEPVTSL